MTVIEQIEKVFKRPFFELKMMNIEIRECVDFEELAACVQLQRDVFTLPEIEISPVRHLVVTRSAGGFILGAFVENELVGFVLSVSAILNGEKAFYSHMTAVKKEFQSYGIGTKLKWAQREMSLQKGVKFIKWTFQPVLARNAFFNLEKLGAIINHYEPNFYGTDYPSSDVTLGLDSDRLFCEWHLEDEKVLALIKGETYLEKKEVKLEIEAINNWRELVKNDLPKAIAKQKRLKAEFQKAFAEGLVCRSFRRDETHPKFLLY